MCDNAVAIAYIRKEGGTRSFKLTRLAIRLLKYCDRMSITLVPVYIPRSRNIQADTLSRGTDPTDRVIDPSAAAGSSVHQVRDTLDRFVCDLRKQEASDIRITIPRHEGQIRGRHVNSVDGNGNGVRLPTIQDAAGGLEQNTEIPRSVCHSHSTTNAVSVVDARPAPDVSGVPNATGTGRASSLRARGSTSRQGQRNQTLPALKSSCVETLRAIFMNKGHSRRAAEVMTQYLRESSPIVYEGHWKCFVTYCRNKGLNVFNVRSRHFSSYCLDLFDNGFQPGTIISHRTSIASVLRHWKYDPANDPHIALLLRSFRIARPVEHRTMPEWDLHVVLSALLKPPFADDDPDDSSTDSGIRLKWRTLKSLFLLAFASARRRSFRGCLSTGKRVSSISREPTLADG